jgi:hypothetical protein
MVHAAAVYIHASAGSMEARERVAARFEPELLRPRGGAAPRKTPAAPAPSAAAAPAPAPTPAAAVPSEPPAPAPSAPLPPLPPLPGAAPSPRTGDAFDWGSGQGQSYAAERMPPAAGASAAPLGSGPAAFSWETPAPQVPDAAPRAPTTSSRRHEPSSSLGSRAAKGLLRIVLLGGLLAVAFWTWSLLDGPAILRRQGLLVNGISAWATVESVEPVTKLGMLTYKVSFTYQAGGATRAGSALAGDSAGSGLRRGQNVLARLIAERPDEVVLQEDFGYSAQRGAMLVAILVVLLAGGWSFIFKVL